MRSLFSIYILVVSLVIFSQIMDHIAHAFSINPGSKNMKYEYFELKDDFTITAYCPGTCCNGRWAGLTAKGESIDYYIKRGINIIAVDPQIIPLDTVIIYNNEVYHAVDVGGKIKGRRLDVLLKTHDETIEFGIKRKQIIKILRQ